MVRHSSSQPAQSQAKSQATGSPNASGNVTSAGSASSAAVSETTPAGDSSGSVVHQVMPDVSRTALNTVHGHIKVEVLSLGGYFRECFSGTSDLCRTKQVFRKQGTRCGTRLDVQAAGQRRGSGAQQMDSAVSVCPVLDSSFFRRDYTLNKSVNLPGARSVSSSKSSDATCRAGIPHLPAPCAAAAPRAEPRHETISKYSALGIGWLGARSAKCR